MRTIKELERLVAEQAESGVSVAAFSAARGLKVKSFYVWRQRAREHRERFVPVVVADRVELELEGGIRLKVGSTI